MMDIIILLATIIGILIGVSIYIVEMEDRDDDGDEKTY